MERVVRTPMICNSGNVLDQFSDVIGYIWEDICYEGVEGYEEDG